MENDGIADKTIHLLKKKYLFIIVDFHIYVLNHLSSIGLLNYY